MKSNKKRVICFVLLLCLLLAACFLATCSGVTKRVEGMKQNSRFYIRDLTIQNGLISYTVVNDTPFPRVYHEEDCTVQQKIDGVWTRPQMLASGTGMNKGDGRVLTVRVRGFSCRGEVGVVSSYWAPGEYRLIWGSVSYTKDANGAVTPVYDKKQTYAVKEFVLRAEDISDVAHGESFVMDGVPQYTGVRVTTYTQNTYTCTVHNDTSARLELDIAGARFEVLDPATQAFQDTGLQVVRRFQDSTERQFIRAGETETVVLYRRNAAAEPLADGYYRVMLPYRLYGDEQTYWTVGYFQLDSTKPPLSEGGS